MKKSFGERLRELRGELSQCDFAKKLGVPQTSYSGWESDAKAPAAPVVAQIANAIGVSADWMLGLSDIRVKTSDINEITKSYIKTLEEKVKEKESSNIDDETKEYIKVLEAKLQEKDAKLSEQNGIIQGLKIALQSIGINK